MVLINKFKFEIYAKKGGHFRTLSNILQIYKKYHTSDVYVKTEVNTSTIIEKQWGKKNYLSAHKTNTNIH